MTPDDWPEVRRIYLEGIAAGQATFETEAPDWPTWDATHHPKPRLVARAGNSVSSVTSVVETNNHREHREHREDAMVGWAALSPVSRRAVYRGVAEVSVYVGEGARGKGVGDALLKALIEVATDFWTLQASIFPENEASVKLHLKHGFRVVGRREKIAQQHGIWRDTLLLERRESSSTSLGCSGSR